MFICTCITSGVKINIFSFKETKQPEVPKETLASEKNAKPSPEIKEKDADDEEESSSEDESSEDDDDDDDESDSDEDDEDDGRTKAAKNRDKVLQRLKVIYF